MSSRTASADDRSPRASTASALMTLLLRIGVGWHFLYEGISKLTVGGWSAEGYLRGSNGPLAEVFRALADDTTLLPVINHANVWGQVAIGAALMLGLLTRLSAFGGIVLLALYYLAYPPYAAGPVTGQDQGHYLYVNLNVIEALALLAVMVMPSTVFGVDGILRARRARRKAARALEAGLDDPALMLPPADVSRRRLLTGLAGLPFVGGFVLAALKRHGWRSHEEENLTARPDARTGATLKKFDFSATMADLKGRLPTAQIGQLQLSRMILGGNLIGGWAHARDLIYVSKLVKAYHHRDKVFETLRLAEACGINTLLTNPQLCGIIQDYWRDGGRIQFISDCGGADVVGLARQSIDAGAHACYVQGEQTRVLVEQGDFDTIARALEVIRRAGLPAGIGAHNLAHIAACVEKGFKPDFWVKTLHHNNYWSARPADAGHDNLWCDYPEKTIEFMNRLPEPWIAFKVLAAGAIHPNEGFRYAFKHGADFLCVGMYDFQIVEDVNIALDVLAQKDQLGRQRPWIV